MAWERTDKVTDVVNIGDRIDVKYFGFDPKTRRDKVSRKALLPKPEGYVERPRGGGRRDGRGRDSRGRDNRGRDNRRRDDRRRDDHRSNKSDDSGQREEKPTQTPTEE